MRYAIIFVVALVGKAHVRRFALIFTALTVLNLAIVLVAGYGSLPYMESPSFCGETCHTPMRPQHSAWQVGPHARIACVNCHVGEGARGMVQAKLAGRGNSRTSSQAPIRGPSLQARTFRSEATVRPVVAAISH